VKEDGDEKYFAYHHNLITLLCVCVCVDILCVGICVSFKRKNRFLKLDRAKTKILEDLPFKRERERE